MGRILVFVFVRRWGPILGQSPPINEFLAAKKGPKSGARTGPIPIPEGIPQCQMGASWGPNHPCRGPRRPGPIPKVLRAAACQDRGRHHDDDGHHRDDRDMRGAMHRRGTPAGRAGPGYTLCYTILFRGRNLGLPGRVSPGFKKGHKSWAKLGHVCIPDKTQRSIIYYV